MHVQSFLLVLEKENDVFIQSSSYDNNETIKTVSDAQGLMNR